jgi:hypothetical protein
LTQITVAEAFAAEARACAPRGDCRVPEPFDRIEVRVHAVHGLLYRLIWPDGHSRFVSGDDVVFLLDDPHSRSRLVRRHGGWGLPSSVLPTLRRSSPELWRSFIAGGREWGSGAIETVA